MMVWVKEDAPYTLWDLQTGSTQRVTEASSSATRMLRVTEEGHVIRITRRARDQAWNRQTTADTTWSTDDA